MKKEPINPRGKGSILRKDAGPSELVEGGLKRSLETVSPAEDHGRRGTKMKTDSQTAQGVGELVLRNSAKQSESVQGSPGHARRPHPENYEVRMPQYLRMRPEHLQQLWRQQTVKTQELLLFTECDSALGKPDVFSMWYPFYSMRYPHPQLLFCIPEFCAVDSHPPF